MPAVWFEKDTITYILFSSFLFLGLLRRAYPPQFHSLQYVFISGHRIIQLNENKQSGKFFGSFYILFGLFCLIIFSLTLSLMTQTFKWEVHLYGVDLLICYVKLFGVFFTLRAFWSYLMHLFSSSTHSRTYTIHKYIYTCSAAVICIPFIALYNYTDISSKSILITACATVGFTIFMGQFISFLISVKKVGFLESFRLLFLNDLLPYGVLVLIVRHYLPNSL